MSLRHNRLARLKMAPAAGKGNGRKAMTQRRIEIASTCLETAAHDAAIQANAGLLVAST